MNHNIARSDNATSLLLELDYLLAVGPTIGLPDALLIRTCQRAIAHWMRHPDDDIPLGSIQLPLPPVDIAVSTSPPQVTARGSKRPKSQATRGDAS